MSNTAENVLGGSITRIGVRVGGTFVPPAACEPDNRATYAPPFAYNTCVDRNGDGMITTSNGLIPPPWPYDGTGPELGSVDAAVDECIISYVQVSGAHARFVAVNKDNDVWVGGSQTNNTFDLVDADAGAILETFDVGTGGYGGLIDCNNVLWSVSHSGNPGLFRYDTDSDIEDIGCCEPDILTDSNGDMEIAAEDQDVETVSPGVIAYINDDDDDGDGTLDMNQIPVPYEDDLVEVRLFSGYVSDDPTAEWSLLWDYPTPPEDPDPIEFWFHSDKSDGSILPGEPGYPGPDDTPIVNQAEYSWPPPDKVWLETTGSYDDANITLTLFPNTQDEIATTILSTGKLKYVVRLHVTMFVGTTANLNNPPAPTAGCRLSKTQVENIVDDFIDFHSGSNLRFVWTNRRIDALRSSCMEWAGLPYSLQISECLVDGRRSYDFEWFLQNVVNESPSSTEGQVAGLTSTDNNYVYDHCDMIIYFVGDLLSDRLAAPIFQNTRAAATGAYYGSTTKDAIIINDCAYVNHGDGTGGGMDVKEESIRKRRTLLHEAICHWLSTGSVNPPDGHSPTYPLRQSNNCQSDLCSSGSYFDDVAVNCWQTCTAMGPCYKSQFQSTEPHKWLFLDPIPVRPLRHQTAYNTAIAAFLNQYCGAP